MQRSKFLPAILMALVTLLSACAPASPTPSLAELQAAAMSEAQTQIAMTAAAMPTATQIPPTPIPTEIPPTPESVQEVAQPVVQPTAIVLPTMAIAAPTDASSSEESNPCAGPISEIKGPHVDITITNGAKGPVDMYLYMYQTPHGCGYGHVNLDSGESDTVSIPKACYDFYGWVNGARPSTPKGYACFDNNSPSKVKITADGIQTSY